MPAKKTKTVTSYPLEIIRQIQGLEKQQASILRALSASIAKNKENNVSLRRWTQAYRLVEAEKNRLLRGLTR